MGAIRRTNHHNPKHLEQNIIEKDFYKALERIQYGVRKDSIAIKSWLRDLMSSIEAGKTIVSMLLHTNFGDFQKIVKVSTIPRIQENSLTRLTDSYYDNFSLKTFGKLKDKIKLLC